MSADRLAEIRARWAQATPGPWLWDGSPTQPAALFNPHEGVIIFEAAGEDRMRWPSPNRVTDQSAIAHAPEDIAWLCAEVERLRDALQAQGYLIKLANGGVAWHAWDCTGGYDNVDCLARCKQARAALGAPEIAP